MKLSFCKTALAASFGLAILLVQPARAQMDTEWEIGVLGLISGYKSVNVSNEFASGSVGPGIGPSGGFVLGQSMSNRWGGEFRYTYFRNDLELDLDSAQAELSAESHAIHYDVLYYFSDPDTRVRPYVAAGFGFKHYRGRGKEDPFQPGTETAILTKTSQTKPAGDFGAGVKFRISKNAIFRVEFRTFVTGIPQKLITPAPGTKLDGVLWQWAPMFGFTWTF